MKHEKKGLMTWEEYYSSRFDGKWNVKRMCILYPSGRVGVRF